jgi:DMSO/TMAO reductase YedYZ molybdopterin-dependent catalytic subunit
MNEMTRRETLRLGLTTAAGLAFIPEWALPVLAQGEVDVPFTDYPANFVTSPADGARRAIDLRRIDGLITPTDQFFFIQHYDKPQVDAATFRLKLTGLVAKPAELSLADLQSMRATDIVNGYECSGNSPRGMQGLSSCGRFTGVRLRDVLRRAGVDDNAREVVFFGADKGSEDVVFRQQTLKVQQQFARSITLENAMKPEPILAWALNGQPLDRDHGAPLRVIMPGWYGVANVKWLTRIQVLDTRYQGRFMARDYVSIREQRRGDDTTWTFTSVTHDRLKSAPAKVVRHGSRHSVMGAAWGAPVSRVEVQIDNGNWRAARLHRRLRAAGTSARCGYSWRFWTLDWGRPSPGEHTVRSRAFDEEGRVQPPPTDAYLASRRTFWENNGQITRRVLIS